MEYENRLLVGSALEQLKSLPDGIVQSCVTSPPYYGLRDYGASGQIGLEETPQEYVARLVEVFREVRRVLRDDGTLWLNLGDSYANDGKWGGSTSGKHAGSLHGDTKVGRGKRRTGFKAKELMMIPARVAIALQDDGWYLRSDIIWSKGNPMPESVKDRPTRSHEYVFLLAKSEKYFYDMDAVREPHASEYSQDAIKKAGKAGGPRPEGNNFSKEQRHESGGGTPRSRGERAALLHPLGRNRRTVWTINPKPYKGAHFATMPEELARVCCLAGTKAGDLVLDPFAGSGTTLAVARALSRPYLGIELNSDYVPLIEERLKKSWDLDAAASLLGKSLED